jgi:hypothetical protein
MAVYTGIHGTLEIGGSPLAFAEFSVKTTRGKATHARAGKYSDIQRAGKLEVNGTIKRIQADATMLGRLLTTAAVTGSSNTLHAGLTMDGTDSMTEMTDDDSKNGRIRLTVATKAITTGGTAVLIGTDLNGVVQTETLTLTTLGVGEYVTSSKVFATLTHVSLFTVDSAENGTLVVTSIAGSSAYTPGAAATFNLVGKVKNGTETITVTCNNCFLTDGEFTISDADTILSEPLSFTVQDPDADFSIEET